jgi:hypothetical protein
MSEADKKKGGLSGTICVHPESPEGGKLVHHDGDHHCVSDYRYAREGQNMAGYDVILLRKDGTFEQIQTGAVPHGTSSHGPAQVATPAYRDSWERTFGSNGGVS